MTIHNLTTFPQEVLRQKAKPVEKFDENLQKLIDDMIETMRQAPGVGLAAPQIGVSKQVIVVEFGHEDDDAIPKQLYVIVNPEIEDISSETITGIEGCLSVPGVVGEVERARVVTVHGRNAQGKPVRIRAEGWLARIFQHEIDHINGVLYTDRAETLWKPDPEEMESI